MSATLVAAAVIALLIVLNGVFVAAEFSIVTAPHTRLAQRAAAGSRAARDALTVQRDPERQNRYLATAQLAITVLSVALGMYGETAVATRLTAGLHELGVLALPAAHTVAVVVAVGVLTALHVVLGEMIPKSLAIQTAESTVLKVALPMRSLERVLWPAVWLLNAGGNAVTRLLGVPPADASSRLLSPEELELVVEESLRRGAIPAGEELLIENIFDFGERNAGQVMTPRNRLRGLAAGATQAEVLAELCHSRKSRYPVYEHGLDDVVGVLHVKDLARIRDAGAGPFDLRSFVRPALFIPESLGLEETLVRLRRKHSSVAIVFDEFGGTAGLITVEDVVEEVVGEIADDFEREIPPMQIIGPRTVVARGDLILEELVQHFDVALEHEEAETVAGLVMAELGRIAGPGDVVEYGGARFEVRSVDGLAVRTVVVALPETRSGPA